MYSEKLKYLRDKKNLNQEQVANLLNIDRSQYGHYEREYVTIPIKHLLTICDFYKVSLDYIFNFTPNINYSKTSKINLDKSKLRLKEFRKENKLTQKKLANILNTSFTTISSYELGKNIIATNYLYTICIKYHISADYLLGKIDNPKYLK